MRTLLTWRVDHDRETAGQTALPMLSTYSKRDGTYNSINESFSTNIAFLNLFSTILERNGNDKCVFITNFKL